MDKFYYESPIGTLEIAYKNNELHSLKLVNELYESNKETSFIKYIKIQLDEYFKGKRQVFDININPKGTDFQKQIWQELQKIPYGMTKSYSNIAETTGNKNAQRAVGSACNKNPIMIIIPCHRVIHKNGDLGEYAYGNSVKQKLLDIENNALTDTNFSN
ncbi:methylated-DNA--[bacterium]|nr:methylated-DNA--[protein]-cysteine S-methyltransferase [bacterium]